MGLFESFVLLSPDVGATAADPLSEFCNDLATAPDEVFNNKLYWSVAVNFFNNLFAHPFLVEFNFLIITLH